MKLPLEQTYRPPGIVIHHVPASSRNYIGSPSLAVLPDGSYVASHDLFGPGSGEHESGVTLVFRSEDRGRTWQPISRVQPAFWSGLFVHQGRLYLMGTTSHHGQIVIRRSDDGGVTWTVPTDADTGLLTNQGQYHTAPVPVLIHNGRLWRAVENADNGIRWGLRYSPMMLSIPEEADLLCRKNWTLSQKLTHDRAWLSGAFGGWLEGNAVVNPRGHVVNLLRVDYFPGGKAALVNVGLDGSYLSFNLDVGFVDFPGGATKFTVRRDDEKEYYWSLVNQVPPPYRWRKASKMRNTLCLVRSADLRSWETRCILLHHPDELAHGFQYVDWLFDGDDIIAAIRTAYDDEISGAHNAHDANYMTFHRFAGFKKLTPRDSVVDPRTLDMTS